MLKLTIQAFAALGALMLAAPLAHAGADPTGVWLNDTGRGAIEIAPCGDRLCGHVVWVKDAADAAKGCGKQIIGGVKSVGGDRWDNGWIYSPEKKRNYDVELKRLDNGNLRVTGYAGVKFLSKTMIWKPAPADLQRCSTIEAKSAVPAAADVAKVEAPAAPEVAKADAASPAENSEADKSTSSEAKTVTAPQAAPTAQAAAATPPAAAAAAGNVEAPKDAARSNQAAAVAQDDDAGGSAASVSDLKNLEIGGVKLDKVLSRKNGKCKLDLPWVKVKFDCNE